MRLAAFSWDGESRVGVVHDEEIVDLSVVAPELPRDVATLLSSGSWGTERIVAALEGSAGRVRLDEVRFQPPISAPRKFLAVGLNYADHIEDSSFEAPEFPTIFTKFSTSLIGPGGEVERPSVSDELDYEGELAFVIGRRCRHVPAKRASEVIGGYTIVNDFSVRDWQLRTSQWTLGKSFDTHGALGPWLVTPDELDPHALDLKTYVNGELRQSSNTRNLIYDCFALVALLSTVCTLEPGDIVATGTPAGVGRAMRPSTYLVPGDSVRVEIEAIGSLTNPIVAAASPETFIADDSVFVTESTRPSRTLESTASS
jgi:2-keto-4-pentenoate hydratase/2-oxohepta-3-ene-1,7-dioic acid hydratase in catechol pathway